MKSLSNAFSKFITLCFSLLLSMAVFAQESGGADINVDINKDSGGGWYTQPWVWIVGGALFILLLVALLRGGGRKD
jgi:hypothetical protein